MMNAGTGTGTSSHSSTPLKPRIPARIREKIKECVSISKVTIVIGPTGSGKSTQVPAALLEDLGGPILCTQPRRLAVVAVATRVAEERGAILGGTEVGYHVGQARHAVSATKLLFTTAGILLQELRAQGSRALEKFKVVVIDECHERSPESDLVLALIKTILIQQQHNNSSSSTQQQNIRIILMSATFDHGRYQKYFQNIAGCEQVDTITLETANAFNAFYENVSTHYLEDTIALLEDDHSALARSMRRDPNKELNNDDGGKTLSQDMISLIRSLVTHLDNTDPPEGVFLIFAPTYRHLEQIYQALLAQSYRVAGRSSWKLGVLHSSVDIEYCLHSMQASNKNTTTISNSTNKRRKILLASAVADSSVTIPGVTSVIDLCRALQVKWDTDTRCYVPKTVWASKSICDQRRGRTGRTCKGQVFRLLPQGFYITRLENWDVPQLYISSCRDEVLKLLCTTTTSTDTTTGTTTTAASATDPLKILSTCLDPPPADVIQDAFRYLEGIGACTRTKSANSKKKIKYAPTELGELLAALPFLVHDSYTVIKGGQLGVLHEALILKAIQSHKPSPIVHHFGESFRNEELLALFYPDVVPSDSSSVNVAHMSAFFFWDAVWNGSRTLAAMDQFAKFSKASYSDSQTLSSSSSQANINFDRSALFSNDISHSDAYCCDTWKWTPELEEKHSIWCRSHHINPSAVRGIYELYITTLNTMYLCSFEPEWLRATNPMPAWTVKTRQNQNAALVPNMVRFVYGARGNILLNLLGALPSGKDESKARQLAIQYHGLSDPNNNNNNNNNAMMSTIINPFRTATNTLANQSFACLPFLQGYCRFGSACRNSHSPYAVRPPCRFFQKGHCSRGDKCIYAHDPVDDHGNNNNGLLSTEVSNMLLLHGNGTVSDLNTKIDPMTSIVPIQTQYAFPSGTEEWFSTPPTTSRRCNSLLLLGEGNFEFTESLRRLGCDPAYTSTFNNNPNDSANGVYPSFSSSSSSSNVLYGIDATRLHLNRTIDTLAKEGKLQYFFWNFPFTGAEENDEVHESLLLGTFQSLRLVAATIASTTTKNTHQGHHSYNNHNHNHNNTTIVFALTLQGDQFSRWNVYRSALRTGWKLSRWDIFQPEYYPGYSPRRVDGSTFPASHSRFYEFSYSCNVDIGVDGGSLQNNGHNLLVDERSFSMVG